MGGGTEGAWRSRALAALGWSGVLLFALGASAACGLALPGAAAPGLRPSPKLLAWGFFALLLRGLLAPAPRLLGWARRALLRLPESDRYVLLAWGSSRLGLAALSLYASAVLPAASGRPARSFLELWTANWDCGWYLEIAAHGYSFLPGRESSVAFYPLWPLLIRAASYAAPSAAWAAFALAQGLLLAGLLAVARLAELQLPPPAARWAVVWMVASPFAFFFTASYTESLFLCLTAWAFLLAARRRRAGAAALGLLASLTRPPGALLALGLPLAELDGAAPARPVHALGWLRQRSIYLAALAGPFAFGAFLHFAVGDPTAAVAAQRAWGRSLETGFHHWVRALETLFHRPEDPRFALFGFFVPLAIALAMLLRQLWRGRRWGYFAFTLLALLPGALLGLEAFGRFATPLFALAWPLAELGLRRPQLAGLLLALCALAQGLFATLFVLGYWMT